MSCCYLCVQLLLYRFVFYYVIFTYRTRGLLVIYLLPFFFFSSDTFVRSFVRFIITLSFSFFFCSRKHFHYDGGKFEIRTRSLTMMMMMMMAVVMKPETGNVTQNSYEIDKVVVQVDRQTGRSYEKKTRLLTNKQTNG